VRVLAAAGVLAVALALVLCLLRGAGSSEPIALAPDAGPAAGAAGGASGGGSAARVPGGAGPARAQTGAGGERRSPAEDGEHSGTAALRGRVVLPDGSAAGPGLFVLATPGRTDPALSVVAARMATPGERGCALTERDGSFEIRGLDPGQTCALIIGGAGWVGTQRQWLARPGQPAGRYEVRRLYGALITLKEPGGAPLRLHGDLLGQRAGRASLRVQDVLPLTGVAPSAVLAGVDPALLDAPDLGRRLLLFTAALDAREIGPIVYRADLPGYDPLERELQARRIEQGLAEYAFELRPSVPGFGSLVITLVGWSGPCAPFAGPDGQGALLHLRSELGALATFGLGTIEGGRIEVEGLPYGTWRCALGANQQPVNSRRGATPEEEVVIGPVPASYVVDLSTRATIEIEILTRSGAPYSERAAVIFADQQTIGRGSRAAHFRAPPYRLDGLEPGLYHVALEIPFKAGTSAEHPRQVITRGGACSHVVLREE